MVNNPVNPAHNRRLLWLLSGLIVFLSFSTDAQVSTVDLHHFWVMRDSVLSTPDTIRQQQMVRQLYVEKASPGLQAFLRNKDNPEKKWLRMLLERPAFWESLKGRMPLIAGAVADVEGCIARFRTLYPELKPAQTYFLVGLGQQGGTVRGNLSLLCVEVVLRDTAARRDQLVFLALHEYVHTQQKRPDFQKINVLTSSIREGVCDFVAGIVTGMPVSAAYTTYGHRHEQEVWRAFLKEMYTQQNDNWVSTGPNPALPAPDLGYFVGHQICQAFYRRAADKRAALKQLIELDFADEEAISQFLKRSGYAGKSRRSGNPGK